MFAKFYIFFMILIIPITAFGSIIPKSKCAIITGASKDVAQVLKILKSYEDYGMPVAIKSNNGYFGTSIGIYNNSEGKKLTKKFINDGIIPNDSYCGNAKRFIQVLYPDNNFTSLNEADLNQTKTSKDIKECSATDFRGC